MSEISIGLHGRSRGIFGSNLERYRKKCGYTQQQIADLLNINRTTYTKYETGVSEPSIDVMKRMAAILKTDVNSLLSYTDDQEHLKASDRKIAVVDKFEMDLLEFTRTMSENERDELYKQFKKAYKDRK